MVEMTHGTPAPPDLQPSNEATIWRYMDFAKLVSLLASRTLRFTKAAEFRDDPWEGFCKAVHYEIPTDDSGGLSVAESLYSIMSKFATETCAKARDHLYVNSWCLGYESMAMWEIYGSHGRGVAIKSTIGQCERALTFGVRREQYAFKRVQYHGDLASSPEVLRDFSKGTVPASGNLWKEVLKLGFNKRSCFDHENEWRASLYQDRRPERGIDIQVDVERLISEVYVGPKAETFVFDAVSAVMNKFLVKKPLTPSTLLMRP